MKPSLERSKKKGIEITNWKVGEADEFQSLEQGEDFDIEVTPPEDCGDDVIEE
jgi:hypothetical protein